MRKPEEFKPGHMYYSTGARRSENDFAEKVLLAFTLESEKPVWRYVQAGEGRSSAGVMTTAGGLLFFWDDAQTFEAGGAQSRGALWRFYTGEKVFGFSLTCAGWGE